jgi:transposase
MDKENNNKPKVDIKLIESFFKMFIITLFSGIFAWKLLSSEWIIDMSKFDFNALLSLILALFSVGLSVLFYFKATDTSNLFYDNTYKFTKDISEILGRIEAGFGERLRHLDEGYSGLRDKFSNGNGVSPITQTIEKTAIEIEEEKKKIEQQMKEKEAILEGLMTRAKLQEKERNEILKNIHSKDEHIQNLNRELQFLKRKLEKDEHMVDREILHNYPVRILEMMKSIVIDKLGQEMSTEASFEFISRRFNNRIIDSLSERAITDFQKFGIISEDKQLTARGYELLRNVGKRLV